MTLQEHKKNPITRFLKFIEKKKRAADYLNQICMRHKIKMIKHFVFDRNKRKHIEKYN